MRIRRVVIATGYLEPANAARSALRVMRFKPKRGLANGVLYLGGSLRELGGEKVALVAECLGLGSPQDELV